MSLPRPFLRNHREAIAAMDFFTVPTLTFGVLYCFFVIGHDRRRILHFNVTRNPSALWLIQQLRKAWVSHRATEPRPREGKPIDLKDQGKRTS